MKIKNVNGNKFEPLQSNVTVGFLDRRDETLKESQLLNSCMKLRRSGQSVYRQLEDDRSALQ